MPSTDPNRATGDNDAIVMLANAFNGLTEELKELRPKTEQVARRSRQQTVVGVLMIAVIFVFGVLAYNTHQITSTIQDCVDVEGGCYKARVTASRDIQNAVIEGNHADSARELRAICDLFVAEGHEAPVYCR